MKKIRKILLILSLSFYLTAVLTPQREKEAHAFVLTGTMVLGALAVAGMGGVIAYSNRDAINSLGQAAADKLADTDISLSDMFAKNEYGLSETVTNKLAESIREKHISMSGTSYTEKNLTFGYGTTGVTVQAPLSFVDGLTTSDSMIITIKHANITYPLSIFSIRRFGTLAWSNLLTEDYKYVNVVMELVNQTPNITQYKVVDRMHNFINDPNIEIAFNHKNDAKYMGTQTIDSVTFTKDFSGSSDEALATYDTLNKYETLAGYQDALNQAYGGKSISIDYEKLADIMSNADSEPVSLTNIETLVGELEGSIVDAGADTVSALTTIWNGIKNIPSLIQSSSTAVLGGISTLTDDLLTGLGNFTDNMTKANEQLWEDAGAVWSGMTNAIEKAGADTREAITPALTGIDELLRDMGSTLADLPATIRTGIADGITGLKDTVTDLSSKVGAIPSAVSTGVTDAFTSAFTVPDNYIIERVTTIREILLPKLPQFPTREAIFPSDFEEQEDWAGISVDFAHYGIGEQMVVDNVAPNFYRRQIKLWISAILYFFTALFVIRKVAGVINK